MLGNFTSSTGSRTLIDILANGTGDLIDVTGTATLGGGTVVVGGIAWAQGVAEQLGAVVGVVLQHQDPGHRRSSSASVRAGAR